MPVVNKAAADFAKKWKGRGNEDQDSGNFWRELLSKVFGIHDPESKLNFEKKNNSENYKLS